MTKHDDALEAATAKFEQVFDAMHFADAPAGTKYKAAIKAAIAAYQQAQADAPAPALAHEALRDRVIYYSTQPGLTGDKVIACYCDICKAEAEGEDPTAIAHKDDCPLSATPGALVAAPREPSDVEYDTLVLACRILTRLGISNSDGKNGYRAKWVADEIQPTIDALRLAPAQVAAAVPDECLASGQSCVYEPIGPHRERICKYCGAAPQAPAQVAAPEARIRAEAVETACNCLRAWAGERLMVSLHGAIAAVRGTLTGGGHAK